MSLKTARAVTDNNVCYYKATKTPPRSLKIGPAHKILEKIEFCAPEADSPATKILNGFPAPDVVPKMTKNEGLKNS